MLLSFNIALVSIIIVELLIYNINNNAAKNWIAEPNMINDKMFIFLNKYFSNIGEIPHMMLTNK